MECSVVKLKLTDYDESSLDPKEWDAVSEHLRNCLDCKSTHARLREAWEGLDALPVRDPDPFAQRRFFSRFNGKRTLARKLAATGVACALLLLAFSLSRVISGRTSPAQSNYSAVYPSPASASSYSQDFPASFFQSSQVFPDPTVNRSTGYQATGEASSFTFGNIQGPFQETTFTYKEGKR